MYIVTKNDTDNNNDNDSNKKKKKYCELPNTKIEEILHISHIFTRVRINKLTLNLEIQTHF
jgi:hypothetical protein